MYYTKGNRVLRLAIIAPMVAAVIFTVSCGGSEDGPAVPLPSEQMCTPGISQGCVCPSAEHGAQVCAVDGMHFWDCVCSGEGEGEGRSQCRRDMINEPSASQNLASGETVQGYLCPQEDQDWYRIEVPASDTIIKVNLSLRGLSPVQPTYNIFTEEGGEPGVLAASPPATETGVALEYVHCVEPGTYLAVIRDDGDDAQDFRNLYDFEIQSVPDPDTNEPNESEGEATPLTSGTLMKAAISCRGDQDWYSVTASAGQLLDIVLTSPVTGYEPRIRVFDIERTLLAEDANHAGQTVVTDLRMYKVLPGAGTYFIAITDGSRNPITPSDNDQDATPDVTYDLTVTLVTM